MIRDAVSEIAGLADEFVDLARLQMGEQLDLTLDQVDLVALVDSVVSKHRTANRNREITAKGEEKDLVGVWDGNRLRRVIDNLVGNAVKYSPDGGPVVLATGRDGLNNGSAVLKVSDHGLGIPAAELDAIFQHFRRGSNVVGRIAGNGIGLTGARHIVEQHGGTILVESVEGQGTTITVRLPLLKAAFTDPEPAP